jgi:DNA-binding NarL/FixJ family response regulator
VPNRGVLTGTVTVVIVEDERIIARHLRQTISDAGYTVLGVAANADDALILCATHHPHVVLMDIGLRGSAMDGIAVAQRLLDEHDVRVIYLTAGADIAAMARAKLTRPYAYLLKPINTAELLGALEIAAVSAARRADRPS